MYQVLEEEEHVTRQRQNKSVYHDKGHTGQNIRNIECDLRHGADAQCVWPHGEEREQDGVR